MNKNINNIHVLARAAIIDNDYILLCKTLDLKNNFYFLPGGHVEHNESAKNSLTRELYEEIGIENIKITSFLGCLEYSFAPGHSSICHNHEYNFVFIAESPDLKIENNLQSQEANLGLEWHKVSELNNIDFRAEPLRQLLPKWLNNLSNNSFASKMVENK